MLVYFRSNFYYSRQCFFLVNILNMVSLYIYFVIYLLSYYIIFLWRYLQLFRLFSVQFLFLSKKATFNANTLCSKPRFDDMNISLTNFYPFMTEYSCKMYFFVNNVICFQYVPIRPWASKYWGGVPRTYEFRCPWPLYWQFPFSDPLKYDISFSITVFCQKSVEITLHFRFPPWK